MSNKIFQGHGHTLEISYCTNKVYLNWHRVDPANIMWSSLKFIADEASAPFVSTSLWRVKYFFLLFIQGINLLGSDPGKEEEKFTVAGLSLSNYTEMVLYLFRRSCKEKTSSQINETDLYKNVWIENHLNAPTALSELQNSFCECFIPNHRSRQS